MSNLTDSGPSRRTTVRWRGMSFFFLVPLVGVCIAGGWLHHRDRYGINHIPRSDTYCNVDVLAKPVVRTSRFEVVDVSCDTLAKDETVRIYTLTSHRSWLGHTEDRETLLFGYDPGNSENNRPQIAIDMAGKLTITMPWISSIWYKADRWNGQLINYEIGRIDYP